MTTETALVPVGSYALIESGMDSIMELIELNTGSQEFSQFDLERFRVPGGGGLSFQGPEDEEVREIVGVIVGMRTVRAYWSNSTPDNSPPDCKSDHGLEGHGNPGGLCIDCPLGGRDAWGTATKEDGSPGAGKACKEMRLLFIAEPSKVLPTVVVAPPGSLKTIRAFGLRRANRGKKLHQCITKLTLSRTQSKDGTTYSQIQPGVVAELSHEESAPFVAMAEALAPVFEAQAVGQEDAGEEAPASPPPPASDEEVPF